MSRFTTFVLGAVLAATCFYLFGPGVRSRPTTPAAAADDRPTHFDGVIPARADAKPAIAPTGAAQIASPIPERSMLAAETTRSWFPEAFLFDPLIVTDASGRVDVSVTVPDRLTTWRVLALAHTRDGAQAGAVTTFAATTPVYVDAVMPPFLIAGDEVRLPIQLVNTTGAEVPVSLDIHVVGARVTNTSPPSRLPARSTGVEYVTLVAEHPGTVTVLARLEGHDAISRQLTVLPAGRRLLEERGGTLAATRTARIALPSDAATSGEAQLDVFPGALATVRSELAATNRTGQVAYGLLLAGLAPTLLKQLGDAPDENVLRSARLIATQRVLRAAASEKDPVEQAALLTAAAANDDLVLRRMAATLADELAPQQHPDGSFSGGSGWSPQRMLVATAACARALKDGARTDAQKQTAARSLTRAQALIERQIALVKDGYTAAVLVASGVAPASLVDRLRKLVRDPVVASSVDGGTTVSLADGVTRADGHRPTEAEASAMAALALDEKDDAKTRADLGATVLGSYSPAMGWGDGTSSAAALRASAELFGDPARAGVLVQLLMDGRPVTQGTLDSKHLKETLVLETPVANVAGEHEWIVKADPPSAALGFRLSVTGYGTWRSGRDLVVQLPDEMEVGEPVDIVLTATQAGTPMHLHEPLPAGIDVDRQSLDTLVTAATISSYTVSADALDIELPAAAAGSLVSVQWRAVPTLAGTLHAAPAQIAPVGGAHEPSFAAAAIWHVKSGAH